MIEDTGWLASPVLPVRTLTFTQEHSNQQKT